MAGISVTSNIIAGLAANVGINTNVTAEIWVIREGLCLAQNKQIRCVRAC